MHNRHKDYFAVTVLPQCLQCSSYTGTMEDKAFKCKSCGALTEQPVEVWADPPEVEQMPAPVQGDSILHNDDLRELLEAYDRGTSPFHAKSEAYDLQPHIAELFGIAQLEAVEQAETKATDDADDAEEEADKYYNERRQALIEAVSDACEPHLKGLGQDIVALIEEYIPDD